MDSGVASRSFFWLFHADVGQIGEEIHADLAFEQLTDILCAEVKFVGEHPEADVLGQMRLQIARQARDRPLALLGRGLGDGLLEACDPMHAPNSS